MPDSRRLALVLCACVVVAGSAVAQGRQELGDHVPDVAPSGKGVGTLQHPGQANDQPGAARYRIRSGGGNGIGYHGGPVILGATNVYYIWYGNWSGNSALTILPQLAAGIGGSPYFNINTTYYDGSNRRVSNAVAYAGAATDNYSRGTNITDADVQAIVAAQTSSGALPNDTNGVYFVLTSADVNETSGFCTSYCGWHTHGTINGADIKFAFVGNPARCPSACEMQTTGPNGTGGADGMANIVAHELEEAVTDPDLNAWFDSRGYENADKCAWTFGATYATSNGALANVQLGGLNFLIQRNWVNANGGYCAMSY